MKFRMVIVTSKDMIEEENPIIEVDSIKDGVAVLHNVAEALYPFRKEVFNKFDWRNDEVYILFKHVDTGFTVPFVPSTDYIWYENMFEMSFNILGDKENREDN